MGQKCKSGTHPSAVVEHRDAVCPLCLALETDRAVKHASPRAETPYERRFFSEPDTTLGEAGTDGDDDE